MATSTRLSKVLELQKATTQSDAARVHELYEYAHRDTSSILYVLAVHANCMLSSNSIQSGQAHAARGFRELWNELENACVWRTQAPFELDDPMLTLELEHIGAHRLVLFKGQPADEQITRWRAHDPRTLLLDDRLGGEWLVVR